VSEKQTDSEEPRAGYEPPERVVPKDPEPPPRHAQDTEEIEGEAALHAPGRETVIRSKYQG
jgi:hypothetical protein